MDYSPTNLIHEISNLLPVKERLIQLGEKYIAKAIGGNIMSILIPNQVYVG